MSAKINIFEKLKPFTQSLGALLWLPGSDFLICAYPARLEIFNWKKERVLFQDFSWRGPVENFLVSQDLLKGIITVSGKTQEGSFSYDLFMEEKKLKVLPKRLAEKAAWKLSLANKRPQARSLEQLSLGSHRKQLWEQLYQKSDFETLLPLYYALGQWSACSSSFGEEQAIAQLLLAHFSRHGVARSQDEDYQGLEEPYEGLTPLAIYRKTYESLRAQFFNEKMMELLPKKPFAHSGRMTGLHFTQEGVEGSLAMQWSKHELLLVQLKVFNAGTLTLRLPRKVRSCRLRLSPKARGEILKVEKQQLVLEGLKKGACLYLDRFMH